MEGKRGYCLCRDLSEVKKWDGSLLCGHEAPCEARGLCKNCYKRERYREEDPEKRKLRRSNYYRKNLKNSRKLSREAGKRYREKLKKECFLAYGGVCSCFHDKGICGEFYSELLEIDHINGEGNNHRKELGIRGGHKFYKWLKDNDYPEGFQILCANCHSAKSRVGKCPRSIKE